MLRILKKIFLINTAVVLTVILSLSLYAHFINGTSVMAMLSGFYLQATDFNYIYETEENALEALEALKGENLKDLPTPEMTYTVVSRHVGKMQYFSVGMDKLDDTLIFYFPGGGFVDQPKAQHWSLIDRLSVQTETPVVVPNYLKATSYSCDESYAEAIALYTQYIENYNIKRVIFIGDSSGGTFALSLDKVHHLDVAVAQHHDVLRLDVAVDDAFGVGFGDGRSQLFHDIDRFFLEQRSSCPYDLFEGASRHEFHHDIMMSLIIAHVVDFDDVGMSQRRGGLCFPLKAQDAHRIGGKIRP